MNYNIDQIIEEKQDYEVLQWFASRIEAGEQLHPVEEIPAQIFQIDFAYRNGFVDLLWSDLVNLVYDGLPALEACGFQPAIVATQELQSALNKYNIFELLQTTEEPICSLDEKGRDALLDEASKLEQKHDVISREFSRGLLEAGFAYVQNNLGVYRSNNLG
ncbi:hypothetical protein HW115_19410 [Verrucomicrobiaceae bacterium N1E253]|uniref:DUF4375 domain-containing protein n=1 Tax=Oceaniferula marina TaxID=2748318 RepID=A0A851GKC9_9BACT|nr:hypothetical protein [Oceaniferula marina]NWK57796.1 hypothetical protein [Oceaniferula marina]